MRVSVYLAVSQRGPAQDGEGEANCYAALTARTGIGCRWPLPTERPQDVHRHRTSPGWLSPRCGGPRRQSMPTVSRVSQTPLYDQLRGERLNADVPATDIEVSARETQQQLTPSGLRLVPAGGTVAVAGHSVFSGSEADLTAEGDCFGRHHRPDDVHGGAGQQHCRRQGAEVTEDGPGMVAPVPAGPAAPMPSEGSVAQQAGPSVDTPAVTRASGAGPRRAPRQLPAALVRSPVHGRSSQPHRGC